MSADSPVRSILAWVRDHGATVVEDDPIEGLERHYSCDPLTGMYLERIVDVIAASPDSVRRLSKEEGESLLAGLCGFLELRLPDGSVIHLGH